MLAKESRIVRLLNRQLNRGAIRKKVFCIGLHKSGTTTLAHLANSLGFNAIHSTDWQQSDYKLNKFEFFSDGGSHFNDQNEFNIDKLFSEFPNSLFILQTRETRGWIISKLKHAGWNSDTEIRRDDSSKITHEEWRYKSLLTIKKLIEHKIEYERKIIKYFEDNDPSRLLVLDITNKENQKDQLERLKCFLEVKSVVPLTIEHKNKNKGKEVLPDDVIRYIDEIIG